jgi:hypothetical protein
MTVTKLPICALVGLFLIIAACGPLEAAKRGPERPKIWWQGDLVELDGNPVASDINIEIESTDPSEEDRGSFIYRLEAGCRGGGFVEANGAVRAMETLRSCEADDVERMNRLKALSDQGLGTPPKNVTLVWDDDEATLASTSGSARFRTSQDR